MANPTTTTTTPATDEFAAYQAQYGGTPAYMQRTEQQVYLGGDKGIVPISEANGVIYGWDPGTLQDFQDRVIRAGIVDRRDISPGARDATTVRVWQLLVGQSADAQDAKVDVSPFDILNEQVGHPGSPDDRDPLTAVVSNPDDLKMQLRDFFREKTGTGRVDESKLDAMVAAYQAQETAAQQAQYDQQKTGGTVTRPPDLKTFADAQAKEIDPVGYDAHRFLDKFSAISSMLGGSQ